MSILNLAPVSLWVEDFSQVKRRIDYLRETGVIDLRKHLDRHPKELLNLAGMIRILWVNDATLRLLEARNRSDLCENLNLVFSKESYEVFKSEVIALAEGQTEFTSESVHITLRGHKRDIVVHVSVAPSHTQDLSRVLVAITDISNIRQKEKEIRSQGATYRQVFESAVIPMIMVDGRTSIIVDANAAFQQLIGLSAQGLLGANITQLCQEDERKRCAELFSKMLRGALSSVETLHLCHSRGSAICVVANASVLRDEGDTYVLIVFSPAGAPLPAWSRRATADRRAQSTMRRKLSERERLVLTLISTGHSNKLIGERLGISIKTVESHRMRIMQKLDIHKATDLVRFALTSGLLRSD